MTSRRPTSLLPLGEIGLKLFPLQLLQISVCSGAASFGVRSDDGLIVPALLPPKVSLKWNPSFAAGRDWQEKEGGDLCLSVIKTLRSFLALDTLGLGYMKTRSNENAHIEKRKKKKKVWVLAKFAFCLKTKTQTKKQPRIKETQIRKLAYSQTLPWSKPIVLICQKNTSEMCLAS